MKGLYISVNYSRTNVDRVLGGKASTGGDSRIYEYQPLQAITPRRNPGFVERLLIRKMRLTSPRCKRVFAGMGGGGFSRASRFLLLPGARKVVSRPDGRFRTGRDVDVLVIAAVVAVVIVSERRTPATGAFVMAGAAIGAETSSSLGHSYDSCLALLTLNFWHTAFYLFLSRTGTMVLFGYDDVVSGRWQRLLSAHDRQVGCQQTEGLKYDIMLRPVPAVMAWHTAIYLF